MQKLYILEKCKFYISPSIYVNLECKFFQKCKSMENVNLQFSQTQGKRIVVSPKKLAIEIASYIYSKAFSTPFASLWCHLDLAFVGHLFWGAPCPTAPVFHFFSLCMPFCESEPLPNLGLELTLCSVTGS